MRTVYLLTCIDLLDKVTYTRGSSLLHTCAPSSMKIHNNKNISFGMGWSEVITRQTLRNVASGGEWGHAVRVQELKGKEVVAVAEYACTRTVKPFGFRVRALYKHRATVSAAAPLRSAPFRSSAKPNDWARVRARVARIGCWIIYEWSVRAVA